jgi:glycosyltransferase involved in cell wall biosynthesis
MAQTLSVVIPCFNSGRFVAEAISSVLRQSLKVNELVVVDDGSSDNTREELQAFASEANVAIIHQRNTGPSGARNTGILATTSELVGFLDSDDRWHPDKARKHLTFFEAHPESDLTYSGWRTVNEDGQWTGRTNLGARREPSFESLLISNFTGSASTVVARRSAFVTAGLFDEGLRSNVDLDMWLRVAAIRDGNIGHIPEALVDWRERHGQITGDWRRMWVGWQRVLQKAEALRPSSVERVRQVAIASQLRYITYLAWRQGASKDARSLLWRAVKTSPFTVATDPRAWLMVARLFASSL